MGPLRSSALKGVAFVGLASCLAAFPTVAWADRPPEEASAEILFNSAKERMAKEDYAPACAELKESERLDPQVGTALNLAYCFERLGRSATAREAWLAAAAAAAAKGEQEREEFAATQASALESQLVFAKIVVVPQPSRNRIHLAIDDAPLPEVEWGRPIPLDPGEHELIATADGVRSWRQTFTVAKGLQPTVIVPEMGASRPSADAGGKSAPRSVLPVVLGTAGAVGVAALGVGGAFGVAALIDKDSFDRSHDCAKSGCNLASVQVDVSRIQSDANVANVMFVTGGAILLATAAIYVVFRTSRATPDGRLTAGLSTTPGGGATTFLAGTW